MAKRTVRIKTVRALTALASNGNSMRIYAPYGERYSFPFSLEKALPKNRIIDIYEDGSWNDNGRIFKIGKWMIDDQAKAYGG